MRSWRVPYPKFGDGPAPERVSAVARRLGVDLAAFGQNGAVIRTVGYSLAANSATRIVTAGLTREIQTGSVRIQSPAFAFAIFSFKSNGVTVTEAGIPALPAGLFFQTYVESGAGIRCGSVRLWREDRRAARVVPVRCSQDRRAARLQAGEDL